MHSAIQLTRSSWAPTISLNSHQNIMLHPCACVNAVFLTYTYSLNLVSTNLHLPNFIYLTSWNEYELLDNNVLEDATLTTVKLLPII